MHKAWTAALLLATMLAGCSDDSAKTVETDESFDDFELEVTDETGIIRGVVVDAAIAPIADALITLEETGQTVLSTANGAFGFGDLEPGSYTLTASKPGFGTTQAIAPVEAGVAEPPVIKVLLQADPSTAPHVNTVSMNGFIACSVTSPSASAMVCGLGTPAFGPAPAVDASDYTGNEFMSTLNYAKAPSWVQAEMLWESTQQAGESMSLSLTENTQGSQTKMAETEGPSPLMVAFDEALFMERNLTNQDIWLRTFSTAFEGSDVVDEWIIHDAYAANAYGTLNSTGVVAAYEENKCIDYWGCTNNPFAEECVKYPELFNACGRVGGAGVTLQQPYELFATEFYNFVPDEGWRFAEDGQHPLPS